MKVAFAENNVLGSSGLQETKGFQIRASAHAFKILSSGLYSDKIRAVLREIGCNAADAHIAGGTPERPFRVKLPNPLDDQFYVQDWGPGLAHQEVMELYTTYFASTKQSSNDFTGAFGLGSKSPFSYTDSFSVVSVHGGRKRTYSLYIGNDGAPQVSLMAEEDVEADWPHGVRVGFAVKPEDVEEFKQKAQLVFQWFKVPPEVRGAPAVVPVSYRTERDEFRLTRDQLDPQVLMGNVAYPLNFDECGVLDPYGPNGSVLRNYARCTSGFVLVLPIGSVQVAASREALQYDPQSVKVIQERVDLAMRRLGQEVVQRLELAIDGGWKALCSVRDLIEQGMPGTLRYDFTSYGKALGLDQHKINKLVPFLNRSSVDLPDDAGKTTACRLVSVKGHGKGRGRPHAQFVVSGSFQLGGKGKIEVLDDTVIAAGACGYAVPRARHALSTGRYKQVLVFGRPADSKLTDAEVHDEARKVSEALGNLPIINLADLPAPPAKAGAKSRRPKGWKPSLPVGRPFVLYHMDKKVSDDLGSNPDKLFACLVSHSAWGNVRKTMRVYEKTSTDDHHVAWDSWKRLWDSYVKLQGELRLDDAPTSYAVVRPIEVREIRLVDLGWTNAYDALKKYAERPEMVTALKAKIQRKHITAPSNINSIGHSQWLSAISYLALKDRLDKTTIGLLEQEKLMEQVVDMVKARNNLKDDWRVPEVVTAYQELVNHFRIDNEVATSLHDAMTVEDVDAAFNERYPRSAFLSTGLLNDQRWAADRNALIQFILGRKT